MKIEVNGKEHIILTAHESFLISRGQSERVRPVNITLSKEDIARLDAIKNRTASSRSALVRVAIDILEEVTTR